MRVALKSKPEDLADLPAGQNHWKMLYDTEGANFTTKVYGIDYRDGIKFYLLIPDKHGPMDVFYSRAEIFDIVDETIPKEWGISKQGITLLETSTPQLTKFIGYPIFRRSEDFIWRLSEGDLSESEKKAVLDVLE